MGIRANSGFSLVEVLVSIVILAVALLGTAGLMASSLRNTNTAYYRSQATVLADDILDRMRANLEAARDDGEYDIDVGPVCAASGGMPQYDCTEWTTNVANTLPRGEGIVAVNGVGVVTITINWDGGENSFTTQSRL